MKRRWICWNLLRNPQGSDFSTILLERPMVPMSSRSCPNRYARTTRLYPEEENVMAVTSTKASTLRGTKTHENLKRAFASESQSNRRYLYFAKQADVEGYPDVAGLFRETAESETDHAYGHLDYLKLVGDPATELPIGETADNLKAAVAGENRAYTDIYPDMAKTAREEGFTEIAYWFETLAKAEKSHAGRFQKVLDSIS
jgi:rubrerythrin